MDSLIEGLDYDDVMTNFSNWFNKGDYTPHREVFDFGNTTRESIGRYDQGTAALESGGVSEYDNGNGL